MNPDRATSRPSPLGYLNVIQRGSEKQWAELYALCRRNPQVQTEVAGMLRYGDPYQLPTLQLWAELLGVELQLNSTNVL